VRLSSRDFEMFSCSLFWSDIKVCDPFRIIFARMMERVNSSMMYSKNFYKYHDVPSVQQKYDNKK
jgi:hypothetical protein